MLVKCFGCVGSDGIGVTVADMKHDHVDTIVSEWRSQRPDLDVAPLEVFGRILRLRRILEQKGSPLLERYAISEPQMEVLMALRRSKAPHQLTPSQLSRRLLLSYSAMTGNIDTLVDRGLVERIPDLVDRRRVWVRITDQGSAMADEMLHRHIAWLHRMLSPLDPEEQAALGSALRKVLLSLEHQPSRSASNSAGPSRNGDGTTAV
jgi:DNA-binding MarR family transcriptional regulator